MRARASRACEKGMQMNNAQYRKRVLLHSFLVRFRSTFFLFVLRLLTFYLLLAPPLLLPETRKGNANKLRFTMGDGEAGAEHNANRFCMVRAGEHVSACEIEFDSSRKIMENGISKKCDFYSSRRYFIRLSGMTLAAVVNIESAGDRESGSESNSKVCASASSAIGSEIVIVLRK